MGGVRHQVEALRGEGIDRRVKKFIIGILVLSALLFGMRIGVSMNLVGFSETLRVDFLSMNDMRSGFSTDFSKFFVFYLNRDVSLGTFSAEIGGFLGTSEGELTFGMDTFVNFIKHGAVIFGLSASFGKSFLSVGPILEIDI